MADNRPIGIYDSGLGGLTVWREVRRALPGESLAYLGDGANCPYGSRPREEVQALADAAVARLVELDCKMVVVACNTATAAAIGFLREKYAGMPIVGMEPAVKPPHGRPVRQRHRSPDLPGHGFRGEGQRPSGGYARGRSRGARRRGADAGAGRRPDRAGVYALSLSDAGDGTHRRRTGRDRRPVARRVGQLLDRYGLRASADNRPALTFRTFADELYRLRLERKVAAYL